MRALVTGGCGFIGSSLAKYLVSEGWVVDVVDNMSAGSVSSLEGESLRQLPNASFIPHFYTSTQGTDKERKPGEILLIPDDLAHESMLKHVGDGAYDIVFHQAAIPRVSYSVENPTETTYENITKTVALFEACAGSVKRVVWASSSSIYGGAKDLPTREESRGENIPLSPYAWQKYAIEDYAKICGDLYDLDIVCLRYFNVFGPGQLGSSPYSTAVAAWCNATKDGSALRSDGDGEQSRDLCYIDNVVQANILAATSNRRFMGRAYNVACGDRITNNQILDFFKEKFDVKVIHAPERPGDVKHTQASIDRIKEELEYKPEVDFWSGLSRTIDWWGLK